MKIVEIIPQEGFKLHLCYDDGVAGVVDLSRFAGRGVFSSWLKPGVFAQVRLSEAAAPEGPGEVDLCPDALYLELTGKTPEDLFPALRRTTTHA